MATLITELPRGGPPVSRLDRRLQTDVAGYTDRYDIPDEIKQRVVTGLDRLGTGGASTRSSPPSRGLRWPMRPSRGSSVVGSSRDNTRRGGSATVVQRAGDAFQ